MGGHRGSERAAALAARLGEAAAAFIAVLDGTDPALWDQSPGPGIWSIGKDVEHTIDALGYHEWIVRRSIGDAGPSRRPTLERRNLTTDLSIPEATALLDRRSAEVADLLRSLTDEQLDLPTRPPRARSQRLAETIDLVLIDHVGGHRREVEAKRRPDSDP